MRSIDVALLNPAAVTDAERMMVAAARLTQRGADVQNVTDFLKLYKKPYTPDLVKKFVKLPHPTIQKFAVWNMVITGASRRFLAQITRHQNEVKFMSASLQYSDYTSKAQFVVPYEIIEADAKNGNNVQTETYISSCFCSLQEYELAISENKLSHDAAAYILPQGLRNVLIISATPYQWKHMIGQRTCNRNTLETQYVMLRCWQELANQCPAMMSNTGPFCISDYCKEGDMTCGKPLMSLEVMRYVEDGMTVPGAILRSKFKYLYED